MPLTEMPMSIEVQVSEIGESAADKYGLAELTTALGTS
jgi:hypothetical protein